MLHVKPRGTAEDRDLRGEGCRTGTSNGQSSPSPASKGTWILVLLIPDFNVPGREDPVGCHHFHPSKRLGSSADDLQETLFSKRFPSEIKERCANMIHKNRSIEKPVAPTAQKGSNYRPPLHVQVGRLPSVLSDDTGQSQQEIRRTRAP